VRDLGFSRCLVKLRKGKELLGRTHRWEDNIKTDRKELGREDVE